MNMIRLLFHWERYEEVNLIFVNGYNMMYIFLFKEV